LEGVLKRILKGHFEKMREYNKNILQYQAYRERILTSLFNKKEINQRKLIKYFFDRWRSLPKTSNAKTFPDVLDELNDSNLLEYSGRSFISPGIIHANSN